MCGILYATRGKHDEGGSIVTSVSTVPEGGAIRSEAVASLKCRMFFHVSSNALASVLISFSDFIFNATIRLHKFYNTPSRYLRKH